MDQVAALGRAPAGAEIVAGDGGEQAAAGGGGVVAHRDVVKTIRVVSALAEGVEGGIEKTHRWLAIDSRLLIDQRHEPGP